MNPRIRTFDNAACGIEMETQMFEADRPVAGFWATKSNGLVCPKTFFGCPKFFGASKKSAARGWPVFGRATGGGTTPQGPGIFNLALCFAGAKGFTIEDGYRLVTGVVAEALKKHAKLLVKEIPGSFCDGKWNMSKNNQKIVGTAQRWRPHGQGGTRVLAHAIILSHNQIEHGIEAINAFNEDMGFESVRVDAHTTLKRMFGVSVGNEIMEDQFLRVAEDYIGWESKQKNSKEEETKKDSEVANTQKIAA